MLSIIKYQRGNKDFKTRVWDMKRTPNRGKHKGTVTFSSDIDAIKAKNIPMTRYAAAKVLKATLLIIKREPNKAMELVS